jgi:hypothetical protein
MLGSELESVVLKQLRGYARAILKSADGSQSPAPTPESETQITEVDDAKCVLYERYVLREIGADEYRAAKDKLDVELNRIKNAQAILTKETAKKVSIAALRQVAGDAAKAKTLSQPIVDALIDRVRVSPGERVEVVWKIAISDSKITEVKRI